MNSDDILVVEAPVDACIGTDNHVRYLEHVELFLNIEYPNRGALNINITSAAGRGLLYRVSQKKTLLYRVSQKTHTTIIIIYDFCTLFKYIPVNV